MVSGGEVFKSFSDQLCFVILLLILLIYTTLLFFIEK